MGMGAAIAHRIAREQVVDRQVIALIGNREVYVRLFGRARRSRSHSASQCGHVELARAPDRIDAVLEEVAMSRSRAVATAVVLLSVVAASASVAAWAVP